MTSNPLSSSISRSDTVESVASKLPLYNGKSNEDEKEVKRAPKVPKTYRDFSKVRLETLNDSSSWINQEITPKDPPFPVKLQQILSNPDIQDIVFWLPHGRSWRILKQKAFEEKVIPLYFKHGRYASFARQVNGWGFRRMTKGIDYNSYYHEVNRIKLCCVCSTFSVGFDPSIVLICM